MLNNGIVHANGKIIAIHCNENGHTTTLEIEDDGIGVFSGVGHVGQAFIDELLRVWPLAHPSTQIAVANATTLS